MAHPLIVSETIYGLHEEYRGTVGEPLMPTNSDYAEPGEVALQDDGEVYIVPVMYTVPDEWDATTVDADPT